MNHLKPKLLVTGLSGLVGSRFQCLFGDRYELVNIDLTNGVDITNSQQVSEIISDHSDAAGIIHLAAYTNVSAAFEQQGNQNGPCYQVNVIGTRNIIDAAQKNHIYMIHVSTDYVFDGIKQEPYVESDTPNPIEWYGQTKFEAEKLVQVYADAVILRLAFPYQAKPSRPDFLAKMMENLQQNTLPPAFTDHTITPTFVDDVANVFHACIRTHLSGLYHMVGSSSHTDYEIASLVKDVFELAGDVKSGSLDDYLLKVNRPYQKTMRVSNEKLHRDLGLKMSTLAEGLEKIKLE